MNDFTVFYVAPLKFGTTSFQRYCSLCMINQKSVGIDTSIYNKVFLFLYKLCFRLFKVHLDLVGANKKILNLEFGDSDIIIIDKGLTIKPNTLKILKYRNKNIKIVSYSPDDMMNPDNQSVQYLSCFQYYDIHFTTKSYNVDELKSIGAKTVLFVNNAYSEIFHSKFNFPDSSYSFDISFIGSYEEQRFKSLKRIVEMYPLNKIFIAGNWKPEHYDYFKQSGIEFHKGELTYPLYNQIIAKTKVNLCFLRKVNRDLQTTRSIEIPAMGGFMLAEYSEEHNLLFTKEIEASYFKNDEELLKKIDFFLKNDGARERIRSAGYAKCHEGDYTNRKLMTYIINQAKIN